MNQGGEGRYELVIAPTARRQLSEELSEGVAFAAYDFIVGPLLENPTEWASVFTPRWLTATAHGGGPTA